MYKFSLQIIIPLVKLLIFKEKTNTPTINPKPWNGIHNYWDPLIHKELFIIKLKI